MDETGQDHHTPADEGIKDPVANNMPTAAANDRPLPLDPGDDLLTAATVLEGLNSTNPLLKGLTDYLVDEGNAEEEILLSSESIFCV